jgi:hypothetical protein
MTHEHDDWHNGFCSRCAQETITDIPTMTDAELERLVPGTTFLDPVVVRAVLKEQSRRRHPYTGRNLP